MNTGGVSVNVCNAKLIAPKPIKSACPLKRGNAHRINDKGIAPQDAVDVSSNYTIYSIFLLAQHRVMFVNPQYPPILLHKPHPRKELLDYQVKQLINMLEQEGLI